ncbi:unnamed protein product [Linum tenue]|uniref:Uncharacterized protein n=1 Tax=Linum tenue TaxID=586396 RepID=A0AAV0QDC9_9ROSI|nr:unnamed protein product [Linum tenue]
MLTEFPDVVTLSASRLPVPAWVVTGLLTVWKVEEERYVGTMWN